MSTVERTDDHTIISSYDQHCKTLLKLYLKALVSNRDHYCKLIWVPHTEFQEGSRQIFLSLQLFTT